MVVGLENIIASCILFFLSRNRKPIVFIRKNIYEIATQAFLLLVFGVGLIIISIRNLPAGMSAVVASSIPIWVLIFNALFYKKAPNFKLTIFVLSGFGGLILLVFKSFDSSEVQLKSILCLIVAIISWSYGLFRLPFLKISKEPFMSSAGQTLISGLIYLMIALIAGNFSLAGSSNSSLISLLLLSTLGSCLAFSSFNWLLRKVPSTVVSTYAYINPVISLLVSYFYLNETVTKYSLVGALLVLLSVFFVIHFSRADL